MAQPSSAPPMFVRVSVPSLGVQKALRASPTDLVYNIKKQVCEKVASDMKDALNHGLFLSASGGKLGKFLEEKRDLGSYGMESNCLLEFIPKKRQTTTPPEGDAMPTPKNQKRFLEDVQKGNLERVKEKGAKGIDPNFWSETGETPLSIAVVNNDKEMISMLIEMGAFLDFRVSETLQWKTPLHIAAAQNKAVSVQTLLSYGAWVNSPDIMGLTPLYYAASLGYSECVERLLMARGDTEVFDESGKGPLHQACMNNHDSVVALLVDFGANLGATNVAGNTPLHVAAARNATECLRWLLMRGADREKGNKSGQTAQQVAALSGSTEAVEVIKGFGTEMIVPPPPRIEELLQESPTSGKRPSPLPTSPSSTNLRTLPNPISQPTPLQNTHASTSIAANLSSLSSPPLPAQTSHLRSFSDQYRSSGEISATVAAATAAAGLGTSTSPTSNTHGSYYPSSNYFPRGGDHHFRSISEYGVAGTTGAAGNPSRRLSHLSGASTRPPRVPHQSMGGRPTSEVLDAEVVQEATQSTGLPTSSSLQSIAAHDAGTIGRKGGLNRRTAVAAVLATGSGSLKERIPGPPAGSRPGNIPPPPPRVRPSSVDGKKTGSSAIPVKEEPRPLSVSAGTPIRVSVTQPSGQTTTALGHSDSASSLHSVVAVKLPTSGSVHSNLGGDPASALSDAQTLLQQIRGTLGGVDVAVKSGEVEQDLDALSMRLTYLEVALSQTMARVVKAETENGRLRREMEESGRGVAATVV